MSSVVAQILAEGICFDVPATDWRTLTRAVGDQMVHRGMCTDQYTEAMIANVERNGPYLVIAPGVALLHARPDEGCLRNAMLIGTVAPPVAFGHSVNDPVRIFWGLAATGDMDHVGLLQSIALLLSQDGALDRLQAARTQEEFIAVLADLEKPAAAHPKE